MIIEARFYDDIADAMFDGAAEELDACGASFDRVSVPGALEIPQVLAHAVSAGLVPLGAASARYSGAVALGCVIRGETRHFDVVCDNSNHWLMDVAMRHSVPVGNGILTVDTHDQAMTRAQGGRAGKGGDAARACLRLVQLAHEFTGQGV